jgi:hypothetical protein
MASFVMRTKTSNKALGHKIYSFTWYGSVNPDDPREFSRFTVKKEIEVTDIPNQIDTTNTDLVLNVKIPKRFCEWEKYNCTISLTNRSSKPILVPNSLFEGLGVTYEYSNPKDKEDQPGIRRTRKFPILPETLLSKSTLLMPSETRESTVIIGDYDIFYNILEVGMIGNSAPIIIHFYWDGLLDPNNNKKITRFTCDVPVEVYWSWG